MAGTLLMNCRVAGGKRCAGPRRAASSSVKVGVAICQESVVRGRTLCLRSLLGCIRLGLVEKTGELRAIQLSRPLFYPQNVAAQVAQCASQADAFPPAARLIPRSCTGGRSELHGWNFLLLFASIFVSFFVIFSFFAVIRLHWLQGKLRLQDGPI